MEFPDDVWTYIMEYLPKPVKKYPYIKELNSIIENRELFFHIDPMDYNQHLDGTDGDGKEIDYPPSFYECFKIFIHYHSPDKPYLDYHPLMMDFSYEEPDYDGDIFYEIFGYKPKHVTIRSIVKSRMPRKQIRRFNLA